MDEFDIPIFKKTYELYKTLYSYRTTVAKQDRYTVWQRCETVTLDIVEHLLAASQSVKSEKLPSLEKTSVKLNLLRVLVRLSKEVKAIDAKKYIVLQERIDEIGKMLGGWIKASKSY